MTDPEKSDFRKHSENVAAIRSSLTQIERAHKRSIRDGDLPQERALRRVHHMMLSVYAEAFIRKIITDPAGFNELERAYIYGKSSHADRWLGAIEAATKRHYSILMHQGLQETLSDHDLLNGKPAGETWGRISQCQDLIRNELSPIITARNRLAHGQWVHQLKSRTETKWTDEPAVLEYNYIELVERYHLINHIGDLVHKLCVSEPTFERDFRSIMGSIAESKARAANPSEYTKLCAQLHRSRQHANT